MRAVILCCVAMQLSGCLPLVAVATVGAGAGTGLVHSQSKGNPDGSSPTTYVSPEEQAQRQREQQQDQVGETASVTPTYTPPPPGFDANRSVYSQPGYAQGTYGQDASGQVPPDEGQEAYGGTQGTVGDPLPLHPAQPPQTAARSPGGGAIEVQPLN